MVGQNLDSPPVTTPTSVPKASVPTETKAEAAPIAQNPARSWCLEVRIKDAWLGS